MKVAKYSKNFNTTFDWYLKSRHNFVFSGDYLRDKKGAILNIQYSKNGVDGKKAFHTYDSTGVLVPTKHPNILFSLLKTKASVNFQIKQWAMDRAKGDLPKIEFFMDVEIFNQKPWSWYVNKNKADQRWFDRNSTECDLDLPDWVIKAVENQKEIYW